MTRPGLRQARASHNFYELFLRILKKGSAPNHALKSINLWLVDKNAPNFQPLICKAQTNHDLVTRVLPRFTQIPCFNFPFSLALFDIFPNSDWLSWSLYLWSLNTRSRLPLLHRYCKKLVKNRLHIIKYDLRQSAETLQLFVPTWKSRLPVMCLYLIPFSSKAWAKTLSTSCHWGKTKQSWNSQNQHRMWKLRVFLTQPVRSLRASPHNWRCRARVFSLAARMETSQGEVCWESGTNYISARPLADFSPACVAQGDNFREGEETLVLKH